MPDGFDIAQRGPGVRPPAVRPPVGRPLRRPPVRRFPRFRFFPVFPPGCFYIDRFGRCCDRFGRCNYGGFYGGYPLLGDADTAPDLYDGGWDGDWGVAVFNEMDSGWDDQY